MFKEANVVYVDFKKEKRISRNLIILWILGVITSVIFFFTSVFLIIIAFLRRNDYLQVILFSISSFMLMITGFLVFYLMLFIILA